MKKLIVAALAAVIIAVCTQVQAAGPGVSITPADLQAQIAALQAQLSALQNVNESATGGVNPLDVARAFVLKTPSYYQCSLSGSMLISNSFQWVQMDFMMGSDFGITNLVINGTNNIPLSQPMYGFPIGDGGLIRNVFLNVNAMTADGQCAGNGYIQEQAVSKGDNLVVILSPAPIQQAIPVDLSKVDANDIRMTIDGFTFGYGYGAQNGVFYAYLPPIGGTYAYTLRRWSDGTVIGTGFITPFQNPVTPSDAYVGISYIGNVIGATFSQPNGVDSWVGVPNIQFNCSIPLSDGSIATGKVIFVDAGSGGLQIIMDGDYKVYVQSATSQDGDMPSVNLQTQNIPGQTQVNTTGMNVGKVVITIIPKSGSNPNAWLNLHRFYGTPTSNGGMD